MLFQFFFFTPAFISLRNLLNARRYIMKIRPLNTKLAIALFSLVSLSTFSIEDGGRICTITEIEDTGPKNQPVLFFFKVKGGEIECLEFYEDDTCKNWIQFTDNNQHRYSVFGLGEENSSGLNPDKNFVIKSDSDGVDFGEILLTQKTGYSAGSITNTYQGQNPTTEYTGKITCQKTE